MTGGTDYDMLTISDRTIKVRQEADEAQEALLKSSFADKEFLSIRGAVGGPS